jgi:hypothetical protein
VVWDEVGIAAAPGKELGGPVVVNGNLYAQ